MKTLKLLFLPIFAFCMLVSCSEDEELTTAEKIIGTWKFTSSKVNGTPQELSACDLMGTVNITSTMVTVTEYDSDGEGGCALSNTFEAPYTLTGNTIAVSDGEGTKYLEITSATSTQLTVVDNDAEAGVEEMVWTKQQ